MITRLLASTPIGIGITAGLLLLMHALVAIGGVGTIEDTDRHPIVWVRPIVETVTNPIPPPPARPEVKELLTSRVEHFQHGPGESTIGVGMPQPETPFFGTGLRLENADGPLVNIMKVLPSYPTTASQREIEGFAIVRFDIGTNGLVENAIVVESSNAIFDKSALTAIKRFRYKARIVDGVALASHNLLHKFTFKLKD